ncbi:carotenoid oxygenase [Hyaloraphidium curvatum]|nr:carotenoid oxygenase [Hyaloraphidium curvatum]
MPDVATVSTHDYLQGNFAPLRSEHPEPTACEIVSGEIPQGLVGSNYLRNGPNPRHIYEGIAYHWFDGDGYLHLVNVEGPNKVSYVGRYINNPQLKVEDSLGFGLRTSIATFLEPMTKGSVAKMMGKAALARATMGSAPITTSNTALVYHNGTAMALMEAAQPMRIQLPTLESMGFETYKNQIVTFTAHPKVDPDNDEMVFFSYSTRPHINYHVANKQGELIVNTKIPLPAPIMMHDFATTKTRSLILDNPLVFSIPGVDPKANPAKYPILSFRPENGSRIGIVPRHYNPEKDQVQWIDIAPCSIIHTGGAWDLPEENGRYLVLVTPRSTKVELRTLSGKGYSSPDMARMHIYLIDTKEGKAIERCLDPEVTGEFPVINNKRMMKSARYIYAAEFDAKDSRKFCGVHKYDLGEGFDTLQGIKDLAEGRSEVKRKTFRYGGKRFSGEAVFAPRTANGRDPATGAPLAEDDGYLVCFVHDEGQGPNEYDGVSEFWVIDARDMETVVCKVRLPCRVPYGFHGMFVDPEAVRMQRVVEKNIQQPGFVSSAIASTVGTIASML